MIHLKHVATNLLKVSKTFTNILEIVKKGVTTVNKNSDNNDDILQFETTTEDERLEILKKKRKRRRQIQLGVFIGVILLVILILLYMFTDISKVDQVDIKGEEIVSKTILKSFRYQKDSRIYNIPVSDMKSKIEEIEGVKSVEIKRHFPNDLTVNVNEYETIGLVKEKTLRTVIRKWENN